MAEALKDKLDLLQKDVVVLNTEVSQVEKIEYATIEKEINGFQTGITVDDPALSGIYNISAKAAELSRTMARVGELYSKAIKNATIWRDLLEKSTNLYEKFKNLLLSEDEAVLEKKNAGLQLAYCTSHIAVKPITELCVLIKKEKSLADSHLLQCEQVIGRVEFSSKCLNHQIQSVDKQIQINEVSKRESPLGRYMFMKMNDKEGQPETK